MWAVLPANAQAVVDLDLSQNAIGCEAARAIADLMRANRLRRLLLTSNPIFSGTAAPNEDRSTSDPTAPPPPPIAAPPTPEQLEGLKMVANGLGASLSLKELHMRACGLDSSSGAALGTALSSNRCLEHLSLWKNALGGKGGKALISGLRMNTTLTVLDLRSNQLDDEAGLAIASHISTAKASRICELHVSDNAFGVDSGKAIAKAWPDALALAMLDVRGQAWKIEPKVVSELKAARSSLASKKKGASVELLVDD